MFRVTATAAAVLAIGQPVLAGGFLDGHYSLLAAHRTAAMILAGAILLSALSAVVMWRTGSGSGRIAALCAVAFLACGAQIGLGFARVLIIHIPLGVGLVALVVRLGVEGWRRTAPQGAAPTAPTVPAMADAGAGVEA